MEVSSSRPLQPFSSSFILQKVTTIALPASKKVFPFTQSEKVSRSPVAKTLQISSSTTKTNPDVKPSSWSSWRIGKAKATQH